MTATLDLEIGGILHAGEDRVTEAVNPFKRKMKSPGVQLQASPMGMSPVCSEGVPRVSEDVLIVHDPYLIASTAGVSIDTSWRDMFPDLKGQDRRALKSGHMLILPF